MKEIRSSVSLKVHFIKSYNIGSDIRNIFDDLWLQFFDPIQKGEAIIYERRL